MRIAFVVHQFYPEYGAGTEKFLLNLAAMLQRAGHATHIVTYTFGDARTDRSTAKLRFREYSYNGVPVTAVKHSAIPAELNRNIEDAGVRAFALEWLRKSRWDVVHIVHPMRLTSFADAARELGIPYVMTLTDFWTLCPKVILRTSSGDLCSGPERGYACSRLCPELDSNFIGARLQRNAKLLADAAAIAAPSHFVRSLVLKEFPALDISVIPHGMDFRHLQPNQRMYAGSDAITFGYCGGLAPHKGVHTLISAFRELPSAKASLKLHGTAVDAGYLALLHKTVGGDPRIIFCGAYQQTEIAGVFQGFDVLVIPSLCYESYSMVLQEAWACSVPVIASRLGSLGEKVSDGVNGFTFGAGDHRELLQKLVAVTNDPGMLNRLKDQLRRNVPPLIEEEAHSYERLYGRVLTSKTLRHAAARP